MTDPLPEHDHPRSNPFSSPHAAPVRSEPTGNEPSVKVLVACLAIGLAFSLWISWKFYFSPSEGLAIKLFWLIIDVAYGTAYGLGLALLGHSIYRRNFFTLAPGHWRLIASLSLYLLYLPLSDQVVYPVIDLAMALLYVVLIIGSRESRIWQWFGWAMVAGLVCAISRTLLPSIDADEYRWFVSDAMLGQADFTARPLFTSYFVLVVLRRITDLLVLALMVAGVVIDRRREKNRDAYHYIGLILILALPLLEKAYEMVVERL